MQEKRRRQDDDPSLTDTWPINPNVISKANTLSLTESFNNSKPYKHAIIDGILDSQELSNIRDEILNSLSAAFKETDLYKVHQTGDLAALEFMDAEVQQRVRHIFRLRRALYSKQFRSFVEEITGENNLTDKVDCAANVYAPGCHLLCHDDVIGTRRVSYILYLSDEDWKAEDGGCLELYPLSPSGRTEPADSPTATLLPIRNRLAFFRVEPGVSFHSVQEVANPAKNRISIQGWFHGSTPPEGVEKATIAQITSSETLPSAKAFLPLCKQQGKSEDFKPPKIVNRSIALDVALKSQIRDQLSSNGMILLPTFLKSKLSHDLLNVLKQVDEEQGFSECRLLPVSTGTAGNWRMIGPPHLQRFMRFDEYSHRNKDETELSLPEDALQRSLQGLLEMKVEAGNSGWLESWLEDVTQCTLKSRRISVRRFRPGLDFTVGHYGAISKKPMIDVCLCLATGPRDSWAEGDAGGFQVYTSAEESQNAKASAAVYTNEDGQGMASITCTPGAMSIVLRPANSLRFEKYVSVSAPGSRWDVLWEFEIEQISADASLPEGFLKLL